MPFVSVSQAVAVPEEEPSPLDEVEEELRQLHLKRSAAAEATEQPVNSSGQRPGNNFPVSTAREAQEEALDKCSPERPAGLEQGLDLCTISMEPSMS